MSENILLTLLTERQELKNQIEALKNQVEAIESNLKQELDERQTDNMKIGSFNIFYKPIEKSTFNSKAFGVAFPELKERFTETKTSLYFSIKG